MQDIHQTDEQLSVRRILVTGCIEADHTLGYLKKIEIVSIGVSRHLTTHGDFQGVFLNLEILYSVKERKRSL